MENHEEIRQLFEKYMRGTAAPAEEEDLFELVAQYNNDELADVLEPLARATVPDSRFSMEEWEPVIQDILRHPDDSRAPAPVRPMLFRRIAIAAAILLPLAIGTWFWLSRPHSAKTPDSPIAVVPVNDVAPGGSRAVLTLAGGRQIILDSVANGSLTRQGTAMITKLNGGRLAYTTPGRQPDGAVVYNTLATPRGGQYQLQLPDGTRVWLNAASSITYPTFFAGGRRTVSITGEAYLEVAKDITAPFHVTVGGTDITVLGTSFDVNAYADEPVLTTTLITGAVRVADPKESMSLHPGQAAQISASASSSIQRIDHADLDETLAWKNGRFQFSNADLQSMMRQLARWYDIDVQFQGPIPSRQFQGEMGRDLNLSQIIKILGRMDVHCRLEGRTLFVTP